MNSKWIVTLSFPYMVVNRVLVNRLLVNRGRGIFCYLLFVQCVFYHVYVWYIHVISSLCVLYQGITCAMYQCIMFIHDSVYSAFHLYFLLGVMCTLYMSYKIEL